MKRAAHRPWTAEDTAVVARSYHVHRVRAIALELGRTEKAITLKAFSLGLTAHRWRRVPSKQEYVSLADRFARQAGVSRVKVLAGDARRRYILPRWQAWRCLFDSGHTLTGIGEVSGFDHATVKYALGKLRASALGRAAE